MSFIVDRQTLNDLGITSHERKHSVFALYDTTHTRGASRLLEEMFSNPLDRESAINRRAEIILQFQKLGMKFPFSPALFDSAEYYMSVTDSRTRLGSDDKSLVGTVKRMMSNDTQTEQLLIGVQSVVEIFHLAKPFVEQMISGDKLLSLMPDLDVICQMLDDERFALVFRISPKSRLSMNDAACLDGLFRYDCRADIRKLLDFIYLADVYISVAESSLVRGFHTAQILPAEPEILEIKGVWHPLLSNPVANDLYVREGHNVIFLTGANMAGKSTFMKTLGIAVYIAHLGFPVPAESMRLSVREGIFTTINLPDALNMGFSHFYAEVRRLKKVAQTVCRYPHMLVIFDELFRGTNVKDAYDATVEVSEAFAKMKKSLFVISTHITEAAEELQKRCDNIEYLYLPTEMKGSVPSYPYKIRQGVTEDRHGMVIIRNEGILDILA